MAISQDRDDKHLKVFGPIGMDRVWIVHYGVLEFIVKRTNIPSMAPKVMWGIYIRNQISRQYEFVKYVDKGKEKALKFIEEEYANGITIYPPTDRRST